MIEDRQPFDESDPFDAIAHATKSEIADAFLKALKHANTVHSDNQLRCEALITGLLVGACGCAASLTDVEKHGEIRAALIAMIPDCFDQAREIAGLEPLGPNQ